MNVARKRELDERYRAAVLGTSQEEATHLFKKYMKTFHVELDERGRTNFHIFLAVRKRSRDSGARAADDLLNRRIDRRLYARRLRRFCIDVYAEELARYELADIDIESTEWNDLARRMIIECVKEFEGVDSTDKSVVCVAMARTWHRFVQVVHRRYNLPAVSEMRKHVKEESDEEKVVIDSNDFETRMTPRERAALIAEVL
ncbi:hypothetical protein LCGC14_1567110 [marine sediment metagenome]|uniref:Uncharacterized protein n=1 Tax=marine sediment metagenome TaxID=412755 RepID=A0A0F9L1S0_9ZZZZ